ncbi:hypothetical protein BCR36DRAFT_416677 [Piromyces finnis]|uniref:Uncharacterized protein n=1 Tax=Piromyces finnis TaxID=1754191 RepID=A0A1Y1UUE2_9FUNG|nr:hypothetical protein BCR36DRAFT_416677 [Piromyces finnis]|eukprot:ORX41615.1 hypothetical protein BCR36DRAFT_416677 [Piromyces finnis]
MNINIQNNEGRSLLHYECNKGNENVVKYLITKGINMKLKSNDRNEKIARFLIEKGADITIKLSLYYACKAKNDNISIAKYLIENEGMEIDIINNYGLTPLH